MDKPIPLLCILTFFACLLTNGQEQTAFPTESHVVINQSGTHTSTAVQAKSTAEKPFHIEAVYETTECSNILASIEVYNAHLPLTWYELNEAGLRIHTLFFPELKHFNNHTTYVVEDFSKHTDTITINFEESLAVKKIYPNPHRGALKIEYAAMEGNSMTITVLDVLGRLVYEYEQPLSEGTHVAQLNLSSLDQGIYFIQLRGRCILESKKIVHLE